MNAYIKKEWMELTRTGRLLILSIIFILFGILNPAIAKLTPWLYDMMKDTFKEQGLTLGTVNITAFTCWEQYFKNILMAIIALLLLSCNGFTGEYQKGTLIQVVTKGLSRRKIYFSKLLTGFATWTAMFVLYSGITFVYAKYFWGDDEVPHIFLAMLFVWLLGMLLMSLIVMFGTIAGNSGQVLLGTGAVFFVTFLLGYVPKLSDYMPMKLTDGMALCKGTAQVSDFTGSIIIASIMIVVCVIIGMVAFDKKKL